MKNIIIIISAVLLIFNEGIAGEKTKIPKSHYLILQLDTMIFKTNDTIIFDSTKLLNIKSYINDSAYYRKELGNIYEDISSLKLLSENSKSYFIWIKMLLYPSAALVLALLIFFIIDKKNRTDEILYVLTGRKSDNKTHRLALWENELIAKAEERANQIPQRNTDSQSTISELYLSIKDLQKRIATLEDIIRIKSDIVLNQVEEQPIPVLPTPTSITLYADAIINNMLHKITEQPNDDTVFELFLKTPTDKIATLTIFSEAYRRVLKNADFIDGCEKQRVNKNAINLDIEKGEAQLQDNGKWQITKKANIKFV